MSRSNEGVFLHVLYTDSRNTHIDNCASALVTLGCAVLQAEDLQQIGYDPERTKGQNVQVTFKCPTEGCDVIFHSIITHSPCGVPKSCGISVNILGDTTELPITGVILEY